MILRVVHSFIKTVAANNSTYKTILAEDRPMLRLNQFHTFATKLFGNLTGLLNIPGLLETPVSDRLVDSAFSSYSFNTFVDGRTGIKG
jgi:hypothetical protein